MNILPSFELKKPSSVDEIIALRQAYPESRLLGGGTDLLVNLRRGIGDAPEALIDITGVDKWALPRMVPPASRIRLTTVASISGT